MFDKNNVEKYYFRWTGDSLEILEVVEVVDNDIILEVVWSSNTSDFDVVILSVEDAKSSLYDSVEALSEGVFNKIYAKTLNYLKGKGSLNFSITDKGNDVPKISIVWSEEIPLFEDFSDIVFYSVDEKGNVLYYKVSNVVFDFTDFKLKEVGDIVKLVLVLNDPYPQGIEKQILIDDIGDTIFCDSDSALETYYFKDALKRIPK